MLKVKKPSPDTFEIKDNLIVCHSGSGATYHISLKSCSCRGFGFHKECRHFKEAKEQGYLDQLQEVLAPSNVDISLSEHAKKLRKDALRAFLSKNKVPFSESGIDQMEKVLTRHTTAEQMLKLANELAPF